MVSGGRQVTRSGLERSAAQSPDRAIAFLAGRVDDPYMQSNVKILGGKPSTIVLSADLEARVVAVLRRLSPASRRAERRLDLGLLCPARPVS
jgi:hypothetical protein